MTAEQRADLIIDLFRKYGHEDYIGEPVSQLAHMVQCAQLAESAGYPDDVILAALLHDIGHLYEHVAPDPVAHMDGFGIADHDQLGARWLQSLGFSREVVRMVAAHVSAKRYLTYADGTYFAQLSPASRETLKHQGGPMSQEEAEAFAADPLAPTFVQLRRWDEQAKLPDEPIPDISSYRRLIIDHLLQADGAV